MPTTTALLALPAVAVESTSSAAALLAGPPPAGAVSDVSTASIAAPTERATSSAPGLAGLQKAAKLGQRPRQTEPAYDAGLAGRTSQATPVLSAARGFARPVSGRVSSSYGSRSGGTHYGLDVANRIGTPIRAAAGGTVISAGPASGFGLWVRVRHSDGTVTVYGHINRALVTVGERVTGGDVIAEVGNRGQSTGPHLHFEVHDAGGAKIDPGAWLDRRSVGF